MSHAELPVAVTGSDNTVVVESTGHRWISLCRNGIEILRESSGGSHAVFAATTGDYTVRTDGTLSSVSTAQHDIAPFEPTRRDTRAGLRMSSDAPDTHAVDGVGEIPADGVTTTTITVHKFGSDPGPDGEEVFLRSTGGTVLAAETDTRIRSVRLRSGLATFRLLAEPTPRLVTLIAFTADRNLQTHLPVEFI